MRFVHTADWQIGKPFARFGEKAERLRTARLDAIEALGRLAREQAAAYILVAGDIFDSEAPTAPTLRQPLERMRAASVVTWHLLPGNHDCHRPGGVWDRVQALGLPGNVRLHLTAEPVTLDERTWLLPAPLTSRAETRDLTAAMDRTVTPEGAIRIGLAHGSVTSFSSEGDASNLVDPDRAAKAGLAYLGLGDWHRTQAINARTWYAGTPEPDRYASQETGTALVVSIETLSAAPRVEPHAVGTFHWRSESLIVAEGAQLADAEARLRREAASLSRLILRLAVSGVVSLALREEVREWRDRLAASLCHLDCNLDDLRVRPDPAELEAIDFDGVLHQVAERLNARMKDPQIPDDDRRLAEDALVQLYVEAHAARETAA
jgi:DNA repair exonuclease SbcCD nuclease subunit